MGFSGTAAGRLVSAASLPEEWETIARAVLA